ncbi:MAG: cytochrome c oxidase subunit II [Cyanothece sp. SIO2G6]|nr:cytochrome c oxidase subunit II [Cyanothece sp. SIO2G6]
MRIRIALIIGVVAIALAYVSYWIGQQAYGWLPPQASAESILIDDLFSFMVTIAAFIVLGVTGTLTYSALFQQADKYDFSDGPAIEGNITLEIVWTAIPFALVIWIATYSYQIYDQMQILGPMDHVHIGMAKAKAAPMGSMGSSRESGMNDSSMNASEMNDLGMADDEAMERINVIARQWAWDFQYPDRRVTSNELHLEAGKRVQFALVSEDVIHGFYIPAFRLKQDVIPNHDITFELTPIREGRYRLRDSEYSGTYFAAMQADVVVESPEEHEQWLTDATSQTPTVAYNPAYEEYKNATKIGSKSGWASVIPASPSMVNFSSSGG